MNEDNVRTNSLKAWILASRPKTLTAALVPVIMACALAYHAGCFRWFPAVVCMVFAASRAATAARTASARAGP